MSEKQVIVTLEDGFGRVQTSIATSLSAPQLMDKIIEIDEQQDIITEFNKQIEQLHLAIDDLLSHTSCEEIKKENEQLRKQIQNYEQLISNSYVGEEETLDGFVGKYVIWEDELQKYKNKNEMINNG